MPPCHLIDLWSYGHVHKLQGNAFLFHLLRGYTKALSGYVTKIPELPETNLLLDCVQKPIPTLS